MQKHPDKASNNTAALSKAGLTAFINISKAWRLDIEQQRVLLGGIPNSTFHHWKSKLNDKKPLELSHDVLERISYILGIYKALHILFTNPDQANAWIKKPNTGMLFQGRSALDKMLQGNVVDLADVRRYLDAERGW